MAKDKCQSKPMKVDGIYLFNSNDVVFENGTIRIKRKYGKYKRECTHIKY